MWAPQITVKTILKPACNDWVSKVYGLELKYCEWGMGPFELEVCLIINQMP